MMSVGCVEVLVLPAVILLVDPIWWLTLVDFVEEIPLAKLLHLPMDATDLLFVVIAKCQN